MKNFADCFFNLNRNRSRCFLKGVLPKFIPECDRLGRSNVKNLTGGHRGKIAPMLPFPGKLQAELHGWNRAFTSIISKVKKLLDSYFSIL